jgi:hypothetical protein
MRHLITRTEAKALWQSEGDAAFAAELRMQAARNRGSWLVATEQAAIAAMHKHGLEIMETVLTGHGKVAR